MDRCTDVPATNLSGHSYARLRIPKTRFRTWSIGTGLTAPSRVLVAKSKRSFGQKNPSMLAAIWSAASQNTCLAQSVVFLVCEDSHAAAVMTISRAQ